MQKYYLNIVIYILCFIVDVKDMNSKNSTLKCLITQSLILDVKRHGFEKLKYKMFYIYILSLLYWIL